MVLYDKIIDKHFRFACTHISVYKFRIKRKGRVQKKIKNNYGKFHNGSGPPPPPGYGKKKYFFSETRPFFENFL